VPRTSSGRGDACCGSGGQWFVLVQLKLDHDQRHDDLSMQLKTAMVHPQKEKSGHK